MEIAGFRWKNTRWGAVEFAKNVDATNMQAMSTSARWIQELYPVDELLAQRVEPTAGENRSSGFVPQPSIRPTAYASSSIPQAKKFSKTFRSPLRPTPFNNVMAGYEQVTVEAGWVPCPPVV